MDCGNCASFQLVRAEKTQIKPRPISTANGGSLASCLWIHSVQPIWLLMFCKFGTVCLRKPGGEYWWAWGSVDSTVSPLDLRFLHSGICLPTAQASGEGNHVFTSLGTETLKVPPHGTLSSSSCLPSSLCSMSACWSHC